MFFKINCYIVSINDNAIVINISDKDELNKFQKNLIRLYKNESLFDYSKTFFKIKLSNTTKININFKYSNLQELKGINVFISGFSKYYCFTTDSEIFDELTNLFKPIKKINKGYSLYASKIFN